MNEKDVYFTIAAPAEGSYAEKRSRFLAFAFPVSGEDDAKAKIKEVRRKYYDARHVCFAYALGPAAALTRTNDDGEPSGTAGRPILGQLQAFGVTNTLVVVVRYFGGVKLGTGGLGVAYKTAAAEALGAARIEERIVMSPVRVRASYADVDIVMRLARDAAAEMASLDYADTSCTLTLNIRNSRKADLERQFAQHHTLTLLPEENP